MRTEYGDAMSVNLPIRWKISGVRYSQELFRHGKGTFDETTEMPSCSERHGANSTPWMNAELHSLRIWWLNSAYSFYAIIQPENLNFCLLSYIAESLGYSVLSKYFHSPRVLARVPAQKSNITKRVNIRTANTNDTT